MVRPGACALAVIALLVSASPSVAAGRFDGYGGDGTFTLTAFEAEQIYRASLAAEPAVVLTRYMRAPQCNVATGGAAEPGAPVGPRPADGGALPECAPRNGTLPIPTCIDGPPVLPLWRQTRADAEASWAGLPWELAHGYSCPEDAVPALTAEDFRRLPIAPPVLTMQPDRGWVLVNKETIVFTDPAEQTFRTELLGYGVDVVATPTSYRYDFGDDSRDLVTDSAGHSYPDHDTFHVYETLGTMQITLTTTWSGKYRVDGSTVWHDVNGTAETSAVGAPFTVDERRSRLVSGLCTDIPKPDDC